MPFHSQAIQSISNMITLTGHRYWLRNSFCILQCADKASQTFLTLALSKLSVCLLLLRISQFNKIRAILYGLMVFIVATHLPLILLELLQCIPVRKYWNSQVSGTCFSREAFKKIIIVQGGRKHLLDFEICLTLLLRADSVLHPHRSHLRCISRCAFEEVED